MIIIRPMQNLTVIEVVSFSMALALIVGTFLSVAFMVKGGIMFILSSVDEDKRHNAFLTIRYSIVGIIVIFFAVLIIKIIGAIFGINLFEFLTLDNVKQVIYDIVEIIKGDQIRQEVQENYSQGVLD